MGLQALLEGAPPLPERKLLWHCALETLLDGTRDGLNPVLSDEILDLITTIELHSRMEELETLKGRMKTAAMSIGKAVSDRTINIHHDTDAFPSGNVYS